MEYMSCGLESLILVVFSLVISHVILDLLPLLYQRLRRAFVSAPFYFSSLLTLICAACFLL